MSAPAKQFLLVVDAHSISTETSGDLLKQGEFYFNVNGRRTPEKGDLILKAHQHVTFEPPLQVYSQLFQTKNVQKVEIHLKVKEHDVITMDDTLLDQKLQLTVGDKSLHQESHDLLSSNGKVKTTIKIAIREVVPSM
ncbi:hypothetical protein ABK040_006740 [Willaertia magna]